MLMNGCGGGGGNVRALTAINYLRLQACSTVILRGCIALLQPGYWMRLVVGAVHECLPGMAKQLACAIVLSDYPCRTCVTFVPSTMGLYMVLHSWLVDLHALSQRQGCPIVPEPWDALGLANVRLSLD